MNKYIHIDYRHPRTKAERECFAITFAERDSAEIFLNVKKNEKSEVLVDTFFHEMVHVFLEFHGKAKQMSAIKEELLAKQIGQLCAEALK